jgi:serine/threonine protein kinase
MPLNAGQVLQNRYRIVSLLVQGGMGAVYRAWNTRLNIPVALKEMLPQPSLASHSLTQLRHQFQQEAMVLARLKHPHLVDVTDFFEEGGNAYLVMNFIEGESLAHRIEREGALPEHQVLTWTSQLLDALAYCHHQRVIHRDVKPPNIIIRPDGEAVLVDFGLVKLWDPRDPRTRTAIRAMGTPEYAPPEQYDAATGHTDARSDIYSLGATLYHALTGQAPPTATMRIVDPAALTPVRALSPRVSPHVAAAVTWALELQPAARFESVQEMATALGGAPAQAHEAVLEHHPTKGIAAIGPAVPVRRKRVSVWVWALCALPVLLLGVMLVLSNLFAQNIPILASRSQPPEFHTKHVEYSLKGIEQAKVYIDWTSVPGYLNALDDPPNLIEGDIDYLGELTFDVNIRGDQADVVLDSRFTGSWSGVWPPGDYPDRRWDVGLSPGVPLDLTLDAGSGHCDFDLTGLQVSGLVLDTGSGPVDLVLPSGSSFDAEIDGGSAPISIVLPQNVGARVEIDSGSGPFNPDARFELVRGKRHGDGVWETANYRSAEHTILLEIDQGSGPISIR